MAGFDAGSSTDSLDYDFSTSKTADEKDREVLKDARGTVPEPSQRQVDAYRKGLLEVFKDPALKSVAKAAANGVDPENMSGQEIVALLGDDDVPIENLMKAMDAQSEQLIKICAGTPSKKQIMALPPRERTAFFGWLAGELFPKDPTSQTPVSTRSLVGANGVGPTT
jgi:hypothetical protein